MSLLRHIRRCNFFDPARFVPFLAGIDRIGLVRRSNAAALARFRDVFEVTEGAVRLVATGSFDELSARIDAVVDELVREGIVPKWRNEAFAVAPRWGAPPLFKLDRGVVAFFGIRAYGVHMNGFVRGEELKVWIGRRAPDKRVEPDKLDNIVAGGVGHEHGLVETLLKEAKEEADLGPDIVRQAVPVGMISYRMENTLGVRDDVLFLYDLEMSPEIVPRNNDGEIVAFELLEATEVIERVRRNNEFKFNVNLVLIDFALRHGLIGPDDPEYLDVAAGLRRPLD